MNKLREYITNGITVSTYRESLEWSNCWIERIESNQCNRILLIGDSTIRMIRSSLARRIGMPVDMIGTSSSIDDKLFIDLVDYFFEHTPHKYEYIIVQLGHHGRMSLDGSLYGDCDYLRFRNCLTNLVKYLKQYCDNILLETVFDSVKVRRSIFFSKVLINIGVFRTLKKIKLFRETYDDEINKVTRKKNEIIRQVATSVPAVSFLDINDSMNRTCFVHIDHIHFEEKAKMVISNIIADKLSL